MAAKQLSLEELEIPTKKSASLMMPPEGVKLKTIDLSTGDPSKMATIGANMNPK